MQDKKYNIASLEKSLLALEDVVANMESGKLSLADSLKLFERGVKIVSAAQRQLTQAEQKIFQLTSEQKLIPFEE